MRKELTLPPFANNPRDGPSVPFPTPTPYPDSHYRSDRMGHIVTGRVSSLEGCTV